WHESHQAQRALLGWKSTLAAVWKVQLLPFLIPLALSMAVQAFQPHPQPCAQCPFDWIGFRGKCYRFSEDESNWTSSHNNCSALASHDLFPLLSLQSFAMRHIGSSPHWVGLTREGQEHPWQWLNLPVGTMTALSREAPPWVRSPTLGLGSFGVPNPNPLSLVVPSHPPDVPMTLLTTVPVSLGVPNLSSSVPWCPQP
uniref:C-type lectin domain-containing protein n=1 Tax=Coturnix japonica TaxID=93934 RepID=A0A8C2YDY7_COTJA